MSENIIPEGFTLLNRDSPFSDLTGPYYQKLDANGKHEVLAIRLRHEHLNKARFAHGGVFMTLADNALSDAIIAQYDTPISFVTVSLNSEFLAVGREGPVCQHRPEPLDFEITYKSGQSGAHYAKTSDTDRIQSGAESFLRKTHPSRVYARV